MNNVIMRLVTVTAGYWIEKKTGLATEEEAAANRAQIIKETDAELADITVPAKKGWEYLWTRSRPEVVDSGGLGKSLWMRPWYAYTERVYEEADFADLQIGT
jgi:hypothetical protein